jgi:hypothetical protein
VEVDYNLTVPIVTKPISSVKFGIPKGDLYEAINNNLISGLSQ